MLSATELFTEWPRLAIISVILLLIFRCIIYPVFLSPLSKVPAAHPLAPITGVWIKWHRWHGTSYKTIQTAFERCGPYIRLGPAEIATNCKEGFDSAYGIGKRNFDKASVYNYFAHFKTRALFSALEAKQHSHIRGRMAAVLTRAYVQSSHTRAIFKAVLLERLIPLLGQASQTGSGSVNILPLCYSYSIDFMSAFVFGLSGGHRLLEDAEDREKWLTLYYTIFMSNAPTLLGEFKWITRALTAFGIRLLPNDLSNLRKHSEDWTSQNVKLAESRLQSHYALGEPWAPGDLPVLYSALRSSIAREAGVEETFTPSDVQFRELASECLDQIALVLTYLLYQLSRHPAHQDELHRELLSIASPFHLDLDQEPSLYELPPARDLQRLPFLNAIIQEGLRLRNTPPGMDPRVTPKHCLSDVGPYKNLPPGIRVGAYIHLIHRSSEYFDDPLVWDPYRWLIKDCQGQSTGRKRRVFLAFSGGSRTCIGQHLAVECKPCPNPPVCHTIGPVIDHPPVIRNAVAAVYTNYRTMVFDESQYPGDRGFLSGDLKKDKLWIQFKRRD
ncbi:hypothetical protein TRV_00165 [Trichophyton verrucosum HKI 0517]|uniref:Cytochrome P450 monooxygenase n=1 Tax=Trichophyton verrucosum (strain HKI 0517) TaxID=663202 RepID=D4CZC3_TRIVH|nr:uncharacterized protein TRV_00165 [Trichophyton verrucosum HKI 0517]EFE45031.1 hypothetical protein TRV_00165 [Trichophyton verrucosum HKI 0517]